MSDFDLESPTTKKIRETIHQHLHRVRASGSQNIVALCPFHDDKDPSFSMNVLNGLFICFSCGVQGNFRKFLTLLGMSPADIKFHYGHTLDQIRKNAPPPPDPTKPDVVMDTNYHVPEELLGIFHKCPVDLLDEGFDEETLRQFEIGVDERHERITFPIRDFHGHLVGISGRAMRDDQEPRYKVYDKEYRAWELPEYNTDKSHCLWNAHQVRLALGKGAPQPVGVVEGFKACMWLKQAGVRHVVALMTKTISWQQEWILKHLTNQYVLMLDNDDAGVRGTIYVSEVLAKVSPFVKIVEYDAPQPTDVPREDVLGLFNAATPYDEMMFG